MVERAVEWERSHRYRELKAETEDINVGACGFYQRRGFHLRSIHRDACPGLPDDLQSAWYRPVPGP